MFGEMHLKQTGEQFNNAVGTKFRIGFDLMLPNSHYFPTVAPELPKIPGISLSSRGNLLPPKRTELMFPQRKLISVPEIAVDENGDLVIPEHKVRTPWQIRGVSVEAQATIGQA